MLVRPAGAAMFAPMTNPYEPSMTKEEMKRTWEGWLPRRKLMYFLSRRLPKLLSYFYRRSFLSGKHGRIDKWMSLSLERKVIRTPPKLIFFHVILLSFSFSYWANLLHIDNCDTLWLTDGTTCSMITLSGSFQDEILIEGPMFEEFWQRDVEESVRQGSTKPFIEEAVLQVSNWGFSLADLQVRKECKRRGILPWLMSMYNQADCETVGFLDPIHIWQVCTLHLFLYLLTLFCCK